jgi:hypothetical protein
MRQRMHAILRWLLPAILAGAASIATILALVVVVFPASAPPIAAFLLLIWHFAMSATGEWILGLSFVAYLIALVGTGLTQRQRLRGFVPARVAIGHIARRTVWGRQAGMSGGVWDDWTALTRASGRLRDDWILNDGEGRVRTQGTPTTGQLQPRRPISVDEWSVLHFDLGTQPPQIDTNPRLFADIRVNFDDVLAHFPAAVWWKRASWRIYDKGRVLWILHRPSGENQTKESAANGRTLPFGRCPDGYHLSDSIH